MTSMWHAGLFPNGLASPNRRRLVRHQDLLPHGPALGVPVNYVSSNLGSKSLRYPVNIKLTT